METMLLILYIYAFMIGCCVMSFINVVIYRLPLKLSIAKGRSFCPNCHHQLHALDLIPIMSYICLRGCCRYCHRDIPKRDIFFEFIGGLFGMFCFWLYGLDMMTLIVFLFGMVLFAISVIDIETMEIPECLILACSILGIVSMFIMDISFKERVIGFFILSFPLFIINMIIPDCIGGGDIKLLAVGGFLLGWKNILVGMFIAIFIATVYACYLLMTHRVNRKTYIAFGPYLSFGMFVSLLYGRQIMEWYLSYFYL